jgi:hypothetical protein
MAKLNLPATGAAPKDPLGQQLTQIFGSHPWQSIQADNGQPQAKVAWRTNHYPVWPRILWQRWQDPQTLIGVRFGSQTPYGLLDIDAGSPYCTAAAIAQIRGVLETIGITRTVLLRSSHSQGLHLYLPLPETVSTFGLAVALQQCLQAHGYPLQPGALESFPNVKTYGVNIFVQYNGHRLPLQPATGSCLLDDDLQPIGGSLEHFLSLWQGAAARQDIDLLREAIARARIAHKHLSRRQRPATSKLQAWKADMERELAEGWTGPGQTNHLLKVIACYGHVILKLQGSDLEQHIITTAPQLAGYQQHCGHQDTLPQRAHDWAVTVEKVYWPAGTHPQEPTTTTSTMNEQRAKEARDRISQAVEHLLTMGCLPRAIGDRAKQVAATARCSFETLYKYLSLWHPAHYEGMPQRPPAGVTDGLSTVSKNLAAPTAKTDDPPNPSQAKALHTAAGSMKCERGESDCDQKNLPERGVRGEASRFPQERSPEHLHYDSHYRSLLPLPPTATAEERDRYEHQAALRQCLFRLQWGHTQLTEYIAKQFGGKRFYQLSSEEMVGLIYRLSTLNLELCPG